MKRNIEVWADYDANGRWCLNIKKTKGSFTLSEISEVAKEWENDFYLLLLDAFHDDEEQFGQTRQGDFVRLYRTDLFYEEGEH